VPVDSGVDGAVGDAANQDGAADRGRIDVETTSAAE
jgi:hypothetical protein